MDELIDFPCSEAWTSHYIRQGITQDYPPDYYLGELQAKVRDLEDEVALLRNRPVEWQIKQPLVLSKRRKGAW